MDGFWLLRERNAISDALHFSEIVTRWHHNLPASAWKNWSELKKVEAELVVTKGHIVECTPLSLPTSSSFSNPNFPQFNQLFSDIHSLFTKFLENSADNFCSYSVHKRQVDKQSGSRNVTTAKLWWK